MKITGNEPVYPISCEIDALSPKHANGLTIRQYFAIMAMQGLLSSNLSCEESTNYAVICADALITKLNK